MADDEGEDDFWSTVVRFNPKFWPAAQLGVFGDKAKKAADEQVEATGTVIVFLLLLGGIGWIIYLIVQFVQGLLTNISSL